MEKGWEKQFIYMSQIIGMPVIDLSVNKRIGYVKDLVAIHRESYYKVDALIIRRNIFSKKICLQWLHVKRIVENKAVYIDNFNNSPDHNYGLHENEILLKETFWDKQIVDISGAKVVRINDLHLLKEELNLWVVHMDVSIKGLLRRLGVDTLIASIMRFLFSYEFKDKLVSWKYVQAIVPSKSESLQLKVSYSKLSEVHPAELADILIDLGIEERMIVFRGLDSATASKALQELPLKVRIQVTELLTNEQFSAIANEMPMDELVDLLAALPKKKFNSFLSTFSKEKVIQIKDLKEHSSHIAGSIMNTEFVSIKHNTPAGEVLKKIVSGTKVESIYYIYVLDDNDALSGVVTLRQLLTAPPEKPVAEFMRKKVIRVKIDTDNKAVSSIFLKYNFNVVPVVDKQNKIKGIITMKDAIESTFPEMWEKIEEPK